MKTVSLFTAFLFVCLAASFVVQESEGPTLTKSELSTLILKAKPAVPSVSNMEIGNEYQVEITRTRVVYFKTATGKAAKMVLVDWKNTGNQPVRVIDADINIYDANGNMLPESVSNYSIFSRSNSSPGIKSGETYQQGEGMGYVTSSKASRAEVIVKLVKGRNSY